MDDPNSQPDPAVANAAAAWVARRDRGLSLADKRALLDWEDADPRHRAELERLNGTWRKLDALGTVPGLNAMVDDVVARARVRRSRRRWIARNSSWFAAAAALAVGFVSWQYWREPELTRVVRVTQNVKVIDSTLRRMPLPDGSVAELNGNSRIEIDFSATERRVRLVDGEAHFIVAANPERPFYVTAGQVTVRAVGTAFNVRLATTSIEVLVTEGKVQLEQAALPTPTSPVPAAEAASNETGAAPESLATVPGQPLEQTLVANAASAGPAPALLRAGQYATIDRVEARPRGAVAINAIARAEIEDALSWQTTRLVFHNTPLEEVVAGFNQFNRHQLRLGDPKLRKRTLTGVFRADNLDGFVRLLKASIDVKAELRTPTETVLLPMQ